MDSSTSVTLFCKVFVSLLCNANWFCFVGPFGKLFTFNNMIFLLMRLLLFNDAESWTFFSVDYSVCLFIVLNDTFEN